MRIFKSIKGKITFMGIFAILAAVIVGAVGIVSVNKNVRNSNVDSLVSDINLLQKTNLEQDAKYTHFVDKTYLDRIISNLDSMGNLADQLESLAGSQYGDIVADIQSEITSSRSDYEELSTLCESRGFDTDAGVYAQFTQTSELLEDSFENLPDNNIWLEIKWNEGTLGVTGDDVTVDGSNYKKLVYEGPLPAPVKRDTLGLRVGGTLTYHKNFYVQNIRFTDGSNEVKVDLNDVEFSSESGFAYVDHEVVDFGGEPAIRIGTNFNASNGGWEEFAVVISVGDYEPQEYADITYDLYYEPADEQFYFQYGGSYSEIYAYQSKLEELDRDFKNYSMLVIEGADATSLYNEIISLSDEIAANIPIYTTDAARISDSSSKFEQKTQYMTSMHETDMKISQLKAEISQLNEKLTSNGELIQQAVTADMNTTRTAANVVSIFVIIAAGIVLVLITLATSATISKNIGNFKKALEKIEQGSIGIRVTASGKDEFSQFGKSLNVFLDKLEETISHVKEMSEELAGSGIELEDKAYKVKGAAGDVASALDEISKGASMQAEDIEDSSLQVTHMQDNMLQIIESVEVLSDNSREMSANGEEASKIIDDLSKTSDRTTEAFVNISEQIKKTNGSVVKIQEVVNLIAEIASQTNLLSLNASIEAARAGEAGRGFAVVASEIQKLAEQTNSSAKIIDDIIFTLSEESQHTVQSINDVTENIKNQKEKLDETTHRFRIVKDGINSTSVKMQEVMRQASICSKSGTHVVDLMTNLSAVAEENAASTEQTNDAMAELNSTTSALAGTANELKKLSDVLKEDLEYFVTEC